jgi:dTDP-glucose pyrophosphorylase
MQAVILAAGSGSRLHPLTLTRTKAMLPIMGKPMIGRVMETVARCGIRDFIVVASPHDRELIHYLEQQQVESVRLVYQSPARGAADALLHAAALIEGDFLLSACDNLVPLPDLQAMLDCWHSGVAPKGLLALLRIPTQEISSCGIVEMDGDWVVRIVEKPALADAPSNIASLPLYCFRQNLLEFLPRVQPSPRGELELQDAIQMLIDELGGVRGINMQSRMVLDQRGRPAGIEPAFPGAAG